MDEELMIDAKGCYGLAEQKAAHYFKSLHLQVIQKTYEPILTRDMQSWKHNHIHHSFMALISRGKGKPDSRGYHNYIKWLERTGKLDYYLDRSISYIFIRDLGKTLDSPPTLTRIRSVVDRLKSHLNPSTVTGEGDKTEPNMANLYRWAQKEGVESALIWGLNKLKTVTSNIPKGMDAEQAQRKLMKIIVGVVMHEMEEMGEELTPEERSQKLDKAIRLGYSYGLTYPFIDDLLDSKILSHEEKNQFSDLIRTTLTTGSVPELGLWTGTNQDLIKYIHLELRDAFKYIKANQGPETIKTFLNQSYVFFYSQEVDREKHLSIENYTNEELYIPIIIKSSSSRLIIRSVINAPEDKGFDNRTFFYGIYNQLADDFADMFEDMENGAVTPYTYYFKYHDKRKDLINPFELYWAVITNLIHNVYHSDTKTSEVILSRAINGLKRYKERMGTDKYNEVMKIFASGNSKFNQLIQKIVNKADDVDFLDKLLRDHTITILKKERKEREDFIKTVKSVRNQINNVLNISNVDKNSLMKDTIVDAANYSLIGDGKRLRPIITWMMGVMEYGLDKRAILPLLKSLEYMHTASLIFDDLPSQDNAPIRRGRPTLHQIYNTATAELTGLFLTQKAIEEQTSLEQFDSKDVLNLVRYSTKTTGDMCKGQAMDLNSKGQLLTLEQLNRICFYKTGLAFEAALVMPAILAHAKPLEIESLKKFAYHAGIAFQIKDDLLDVEGDMNLTGKTIGKDLENNNSTFVSILGEEGAKKAMWEHYCLATEVLAKMSNKTTFLKHLLHYIVNRDY